mgnify:CR=1 FL=1
MVTIPWSKTVKSLLLPNERPLMISLAGSVYDTFKVTLSELSTYKYKALVFESPYSDFLNPKKIKPYSANYIAEILSDIAVRFSEIQIVFCDNRKFAQEWLYRWFLRINAE